MSNNLTRKGLAVSSGLAIALTSLVGVAPATAAAGDVTISPYDGENWSVFNTDSFEIDVDYASFLDFEGYAVALTNSDGQAFLLENTDTDFDMIIVDSRGAVRTSDSSTLLGVGDDLVLDFDALDAVRIHIYDYIDWWEDSTPEFRPLVYSASDSTPDIGDGAGDGGWNYASYGDGDFSLGVQAFFETGSNINFGTIEANWASEVETVNFYDPATVTLSPRIERWMQQTGDDSYTARTNTDGSDLSWSLGFSKPINLDQTDEYQWLVTWTSGSRSYSELLDEDVFDLDYLAGYWEDEDYDGQGRFYIANEHEDLALYYDEPLAGTPTYYTSDVTWSVYELDNLYEDAAEDDLFDGGDEINGVNLTGDERADLDSVIEDLEFLAEDFETAAGSTHTITVVHVDAPASSRKFTSASFTVPTGSSDATDVRLTVGDAVNSSQPTATPEDITLRAGTKAFSYTAQLYKADGADVDLLPDVLEEAGVPVMVVLEAGDYLVPDATITVNGTPISVKNDQGAVIATAITDSKGKAVFTVTHSSAVAASDYELTPFFVNAAGGASPGGLSYDVAYEATAVELLEADSELVSGSKIELTFSVTDQFGEPIATAGTKPLSVELTASDSEDLELTAPVSATGEVKFSFDNYLSVGETDVLQAQLFTGSATASPLAYIGVADQVELYNTPAASSISVAANATATVTYVDFITGAGTADTRPSTDDATLYTGTVLDANGAGIPGALVTVAANGFQFRKTGVNSYFKDSINVVADTNGQFSVQFWVHEASATGKTLTVTSGGKTATTTVKSYLPEGLSGANLSFSWTLPATVVKNTTYAVVAKLTDKWGNPVSTVGADPEAVKFTGSGSVEINSVAVAVGRNFNKDGAVTVFLRSVKDIAGPGEISAVLTTDAEYNGTADGTGVFGNLDAITTNVTTTAWDETKWSRELSASIEVLDQAPAPAGKVNVGSFNGKLVVYASGLQGSTISWKVAGRWGKAVASSNYVRFDRPTARVGVDVIVEIYVNGVKQLTKTVRTR